MNFASERVSPGNRKAWEDRLIRAQELKVQHPNAAPLLRFYEEVLKFQMELAGEFTAELRPALGLRQQIDPNLAVRKFPKLLALADRSGLEALRVRARDLGEAGERSWRSILDTALVNHQADPSTADYPEPGPAGANFVDLFFARACLQPAAENLQLQLPKDRTYGQSICPACESLPQMSVLRPEGEGSGKWLLCSFCLGEWPFRRIACPSCGEEDKEKLPRYSAAECPYVYVEACDRCKRYLKTVDLTIDGRAVPLVDEAALAVLDVWASDRGYTKIIKNLAGF